MTVNSIKTLDWSHRTQNGRHELVAAVHDGQLIIRESEGHDGRPRWDVRHEIMTENLGAHGSLQAALAAADEWVGDA